MINIIKWDFNDPIFNVMVFQIDNIPMVPDEPNSFFVDFLGYKMKIYIFESI